jgi:hypothetical protein
MRIRRTMLLMGLFCLFFSGIQAKKPNYTTNLDTVPRVFTLGEYDGKPFESIKANHETTLLSACKNDMEAAYYMWVHMLKYMETHSKKVGYDLNGVKMWLYVFFEKDGNIKNIAYYPKPNSKNFKAEEMTAFLSSFCKTYSFPLKFDKNFSNYSNATFPVLIENPVTTDAKTVNGKGLGTKD